MLAAIMIQLWPVGCGLQLKPVLGVVCPFVQVVVFELMLLVGYCHLDFIGIVVLLRLLDCAIPVSACSRNS